MASVDRPRPTTQKPLLERRCQCTAGLTIYSQRWGVLRLFGDRLELTAEKKGPSFSTPRSQFHSPRNWIARGITIYRGDERMKFDFSYQGPIEQTRARLRADSPGLMMAQGRSEDRRGEQNATRTAKAWAAALDERVTATAPQGVKVKKTYGPDERNKYLALVVGSAVLLVAFGMTIFIVVVVNLPKS